MLAGLYGQGSIQFTSSDTSLQTAFSRAKEIIHKGRKQSSLTNQG